MSSIKPRSTIVFAEDDPADQLLVKMAFDQADITTPVHLVDSGSGMLEYLRGEGRYANRNDYPPADLVLMDLEMPGLDGRQTLNRIKHDPALRHLPVVIVTSSADEADVCLAYEWGAASYITKPSDTDSWANILRVVAEYWLDIVTKPTDFRLAI